MSIGNLELDTFSNIPCIIENYFLNIPQKVLDIKRNESTWTIREHLVHLLGVQEMLLGRMIKIIIESSPKIEPFFPDKENKNDDNKYKNLSVLFEEYKLFRTQQINHLNFLDDTTLDKSADHKEYINYSIRLMVNHMIYHEYWHMYRIEEIWLTKEEYFL
jgi:uncharacterized damage-inducible protein DinB